MTVGTLGLVGIGAVSIELAELATVRGVAVVALVTDGVHAARAVARIAQALDRRVARGELAPEARDAARVRVRLTRDPAALAACDLVCVTGLDPLPLERATLADLESHLTPRTVLASDADPPRLARLAESLLRPCRLVGLRFVVPVATAAVAEVAATPRTAGDAVELASGFVNALGKVPVRVHVDAHEPARAPLAPLAPLAAQPAPAADDDRPSLV